MQSSLITRLISRFVAPVVILVTVVVFFPGWRASLSTKMLAVLEESNLNCRQCTLVAPLDRLQALVHQAMPMFAYFPCLELDCQLRNQLIRLFSRTVTHLLLTTTPSRNTTLNFSFCHHQPLTQMRIAQLI
ncbi:hypothetical protein Goari_024079 [Gossypium aridum]|uniref:Uncharacterized protein n=1 Tax=Gossypium aridum TaxID=34290 RepID=A0A7J8X518_GOSAI|nr:hypothetical protein [Gossypium aridum]